MLFESQFPEGFRLNLHITDDALINHLGSEGAQSPEGSSIDFHFAPVQTTLVRAIKKSQSSDGSSFGLPPKEGAFNGYIEVNGSQSPEGSGRNLHTWETTSPPRRLRCRNPRWVQPEFLRVVNGVVPLRAVLALSQSPERSSFEFHAMEPITDEDGHPSLSQSPAGSSLNFGQLKPTGGQGQSESGGVRGPDTGREASFAESAV